MTDGRSFGGFSTIRNFKKGFRFGTVDAVNVTNKVTSYFVVVLLVQFTTSSAVAWDHRTICNFSRIKIFDASKYTIVRLFQTTLHLCRLLLGQQLPRRIEKCHRHCPGVHIGVWDVFAICKIVKWYDWEDGSI